MLLQLKNAVFHYGDNLHPVFSNVNLEINEGDRIGLVGDNGIGKSTLLNCMCGVHRLAEGELYRKNNSTIGYLKQNADFVSSRTVYEELSSVFDDCKKVLSDIHDVSRQLSSAVGREYDVLSQKYQRLLDVANACEAYDVDVKVATVINGMGLGSFTDSVVDTLSGGEKTKVALCKLLLSRPDLMVLDEPTNHLDYKTLDWLEDFLSQSKCAFVVVSHDRFFLDRLCNKIWDANDGLYCYNGNYTSFVRQKDLRRSTLQKQADKQQKEIDKLTDYIARNKVRASTANMAKSREKQLEKIQPVKLVAKDALPPLFRFEFTVQPVKDVLTVKDFSVTFDKRTVLDSLNLHITRGEKVALIGLNGTGKSTLLRRIAGGFAAGQGKIVLGANVRMGFYDQENLNLQPQLRVLDQLWFDNTRMSQTEVRSLLAKVRLGADDIDKHVGDLSGGERARLALAMLMAKDNNFLVLDEPTNHLDLSSRESLENALVEYQGTILFVSHDRYFINKIAGKVDVLQDGRITEYSGNYDSYLQQSRKEKQQAESANNVTPVVTKGYRSPKQRALETNLKARLKAVEQSLVEMEREEQKLNALLVEQAADYNLYRQTAEQLEQLEQKYQKAMEEWEQLSLQLQ